MHTEVYNVMKKYAQMMMEQEYSVGTVPKMLWETGGKVYGTRDGANFKKLQENDVIELDMKRIPNLDGMSKAIVYSQTPYCQQWLRDGEGFMACLDDMAQIIGQRVFVVDGTKTPRKVNRLMKKALRYSAGCFVFVGYDKKGVPQGYTVTTGRNLYEAVVAMTVLEKSAEVAIKAGVLGGAKPINKRIARRMRNFYKLKYSQAEQEIKSAEGKEV